MAGGLQPLGGYRAAVTKNQKAIQAALGAELLEAEQGAQGLAGTRAGVHQQVMAPRDGIEQLGAQQLDQTGLPLARLNFDGAGLDASGGSGSRARRAVEIKRWWRHPAILRAPASFAGHSHYCGSSLLPWLN